MEHRSERGFQRIEELEREIGDLREELRRREEQLERAETELERAEAEIERLRKELAAAQGTAHGRWGQGVHPSARHRLAVRYFPTSLCARGFTQEL